MNVIPLAADSMGVRSSAVLVETSGHKVLIDPGAAVAPMRDGLPPSTSELAALKKFKSVINTKARRADVLIISHYHHDHFNPRARFYEGKKVFVKSWRSDINFSQRERAFKLRDKFKRMGVLNNVKLTDGTRVRLEDGLEIGFSPAVPHGPAGTQIGYVVMTTIDDGNYRFMHCSDVQGPVESATAGMIIDHNPDLVYIDGPPTNLLDSHFERPDLEKAINNILDIITCTSAKIILDHHLLRDKQFRSTLRQVYAQGSRVVTAAEFLGLENNLMEATRAVLQETAGDSIE